MPELRITVTAEDADKATEIKDKFYKDLYEQKGEVVIFEVPVTAQEKADEIVAFAKANGAEASTEETKDELGDAEPVDFW